MDIQQLIQALIGGQSALPAVQQNGPPPGWIPAPREAPDAPNPPEWQAQAPLPLAMPARPQPISNYAEWAPNVRYLNSLLAQGTPNAEEITGMRDKLLDAITDLTPLPRPRPRR